MSGLVHLYDVRPERGLSLFLQPRGTYGALNLELLSKLARFKISTINMSLH